jgi:hypothetical protein
MNYKVFVVKKGGRLFLITEEKCKCKYTEFYFLPRFDLKNINSIICKNVITNYIKMEEGETNLGFNVNGFRVIFYEDYLEQFAWAILPTGSEIISLSKEEMIIKDIIE